MTTITKFKAIDGKEFDTEKECVEYENLIETVKTIMSKLKEKPNSCDFSNGSGYIQQNQSDLKIVKIQLLELCKKYIDHKWIQQTIDDDTVHLSYAGRLISEYSNLRPIDFAWSRLMCVDSQFREWGQPYFATHPEEAKQVCLS